MTLSEFFEDKYLAHHPGSNGGTIRLYRIVLKKFGQFLGSRPTLDDLQNDKVGLFLSAELRSGLKPATVKGERAKILALWRHANLIGLVAIGPLVAEIKEPEKLPTALTVPQLNQLILAFDSLRGSTGGLPNCDIVRACFAIQFFTGARIGEVRQLHWSDIASNVITFRAEIRKGGKRSLVRSIPADALDQVERLRGKRVQIFPGLSENKAAILYYRLFEQAKIDRPQHKTSHLLRSSHATYVHQSGGNATDSLGHSSNDVTRRCYLDPRFAAVGFSDLLPDLEWS